jgi:hypothetical protein
MLLVRRDDNGRGDQCRPPVHDRQYYSKVTADIDTNR